MCVDASLILAWLLGENHGPQVRALIGQWLEDGTRLFSAALFFAEVTSVLRSKVHFGHISEGDGQAALDDFLALAVSPVDAVSLQPLAWQLAKQYNQPRAYDSQYLAAALNLNCALWTVDERLAHAVREPWVRLLS